ncbi:MAG: bifunctional (p)ppGpp synthetase/guanosine-3',5'-bis(diphosphate) 3'-pyrophosphohydrolase [Gammaproteobacteria bacterium]|nr:bifunctional (p)ppGpp synthetase/guanosine-3',5'-bis(diphosphate) 3'-pyrophosphohydrolase [Gammaproteobacteria bacterium]
MVKLRKRPYHNEDGSLNVELWLDTLAQNYPKEHLDRVRQVIDLVVNLGADVPALSEQYTCLDLGLQMAALLAELSADETTLIAALTYHLVVYADFNLDDIKSQIGMDVANLIAGALRMDEISVLLHAQNNTAENLPSRIHNLRKMLLAMAKDVRVVILKLSEKMCHLRAASHLEAPFRKRIATEVKEIYAPLTNRLGLGHLKWEMEDSVFRYLQEESYKELAKALDQKRIEREEYIAHFQEGFHALLRSLDLDRYELTGRAKHLYSIHKKMLRKKVGLEKIYDSFAVRVLVPDIQDCYKVLSLVHETWTPINEEFDDYIAKPKENGYQSLHTAVVGPNNKNVEVQIRTFEMHEVSELGVAAHWKYKEGAGPISDYENKIAWLRQLIAWQSDYLHQDNREELFQTSSLFDDRVYVFTPEGDIIDLKKGATPIDFAYHVHSEVGHRCKGAKINDKIVPLSYTLQTGDRVSIITGKNAHPSLDWLDPKAAFVTTSKARAKILQWLKAQNYQENIEQGMALLNETAKRDHLKLPPLLPIAQALHFKSIEDMLAALGGGAIKLAHILNKIIVPASSDEHPPISHKTAAATKNKNNISVYGLNDVLHTIAKCCKPIPGDPIAGFITQQRGITVHHQDCRSLQQLSAKERVIAVDWRDNNASEYTVELRVIAYPQQELIKDMTALISQEKIYLTRINSSQMDHKVRVDLLVMVKSAEQLKHFIQQLRNMPDVTSVERLMAV